MQKRHLGALCLALAASIWGGMYVVSKVVLNVIPPLTLVWLRYVVALAALAAAMGVLRQPWRMRGRDFGWVAAVGVIGYALSIWTQFLGTKLSTAQMGAMITSATPAFMVVFARLLLGERVTVRKVTSVVLATAGVLCIVGIGSWDAAYRLGGAVLVVAALTWALQSVLVKRVSPDVSQLTVTFYAILVAAVVITPFITADLARIPTAVWTRPGLIAGVLYLGVVSTAGAFFLWNKGLQLVDASSGGLYFFFQPLAGTLLGWSMLGERVGIAFWAGAVLILAGVLLVIREERAASPSEHDLTQAGMRGR